MLESNLIEWKDLTENQSRAEWVRFSRFSAWRTEDLKTRRTEMSQGLDLYCRLDSLVMTGACLSSREEMCILAGLD